jgi:hypothetical protein
MQVTAKQMIPAVGRQALLNTDGMQFPVTIHDVRNVWGNNQALVAPVNGKGLKWVSVERLTIVA